MRILSFFLPILGFAAAVPVNNPNAAVFLLAGDSTTATQSKGGGGWGDGFKNFTLKSPSFAVNYGHNGATTKSFRDGGDWERVLNSLKEYSKNFGAVYVTIQFGHNDQKLSNFSETFKANLRKMVSEVKKNGGIPVLVTPLSRRKYTSDHVISDNLRPWAQYTISVAEETKTQYIDLLSASITYLEKIGEGAARRLDLVEGDQTHLNVHGSIVFGRMVSDLLVKSVDGVSKVTKKDEKLSQQIRDGIPSY